MNSRARNDMFFKRLYRWRIGRETWMKIVPMAQLDRWAFVDFRNVPKTFL